jgi:hypothetical protein
MQSEFVIHTDQKSLVHLNEQRLHTPWQQKVFYKLLGLRYKVVYRRGVDNGVADVLCRRHHSETLLAISAPSLQWLSSLQDWYIFDPEATTLLFRLVVDASAQPPFSLQQGIIRYKHCIWLGSNKPLQQQIISALHDSPVRGHSGAPAILQKIRNLFFWPGMRNDILQFVQNYVVCLQAKPNRARYPRLLQPLPVPSTAWEIIFYGFHRRATVIGECQCYTRGGRQIH